MSSLKSLSDLVAKINRLNKDRMLQADMLELQRQIKGVDGELNVLQQARANLTLEITRLKKELAEARQKPAESLVSPLPRRVAVDFVWKTEKA